MQRALLLSVLLLLALPVASRAAPPTEVDGERALSFVKTLADDSFAGCIINVGSISATVVSPNRGDYCISKAGLGMMSSLFAARLGEFAIPVYEIRPGIIKTDMTAGVTGKYDNLIDNTELLVEKRWGVPEDIGKLAAAMARGDLPYATGQAIYVDGGLTMNRL